MGFGHSLHFDSSGENNFAFDILPIKECYIECDDKQQPRFYATRNHPQVLQAPRSFHLFGANNGTQYLHANGGRNELFDCIDPKEYLQFLKNHLCMRMGGLEYHNGVYNLEM